MTARPVTVLDEGIAQQGGAAAVVVKARAAALASEPAVRLRRGDSVTLEPVRWLWPGFLPAGMLTILGGAPGCGGRYR